MKQILYDIGKPSEVAGRDFYSSTGAFQVGEGGELI